MNAQLNLFQTEDETALEAVTNLKAQMDALRRRYFADMSECKKEIEFLSLQLQLLVEERMKDERMD